MLASADCCLLRQTLFIALRWNECFLLGATKPRAIQARVSRCVLSHSRLLCGHHTFAYYFLFEFAILPTVRFIHTSKDANLTITFSGGNFEKFSCFMGFLVPIRPSNAGIFQFLHMKHSKILENFFFHHQSEHDSQTFLQLFSVNCRFSKEILQLRRKEMIHKLSIFNIWQ